jgi:hypothetical protein
VEKIEPQTSTPDEIIPDLRIESGYFNDAGVEVDRNDLIGIAMFQG